MLHSYLNAATPSPYEGALNKIFDAYQKKGENPGADKNLMDMYATQKYCEDMGISLEHIEFLILSAVVGSKSAGEITREGFVKGWAEVG